MRVRALGLPKSLSGTRVVVRERAHYPELVTRVGGRDRPCRVERLANGLWRVDWRSGAVSSYERDPRLDLSLGYEPKPAAAGAGLGGGVG